MTAPAYPQISRSAEARNLRWKLRAVRARQYLVNAGTGGIYAVAVFAGVVISECALDNFVEFPWCIRLLILALGLAGAGWTFWRYSPLSRWLSETELALVVERAAPEFRGRFVSSIQLSRSTDLGMSAALIQALLAETAATAARLDFRQVVKADVLKRAAKAGLALLVFASVLFLGSGVSRSVLLLRRALLSHAALPHKTRIVAITGDRTIAAGQKISIEAMIEGVVPANGKLVVKTDSGQKHEFTLEPDSLNHARFRRVLMGTQEGFHYFVRINDAVSRNFGVKVLVRPSVVRLDCEQRYPAYTGLGRVKRTLGDLRLLAGSRLNLEVEANSALQRASIKLAGRDKEIPAQLQGAKNLFASILIPAKGSGGFSINLTDQNGLTSEDAAVHPFEIIPDLPPVVKLTSPEEHDDTITPQGLVVIGYQASDDFGIKDLALHYTVKSDTDADGSKAIERTAQLPVSGNSKRVDGQFDWKIAALAPAVSIGSTIEYWIEASDNNDVTGPGIGKSARYHLKVITPEEKRAELAEKLMSSFRTLNDVTSDQEKLNGEMKKAIEGKYAP